MDMDIIIQWILPFTSRLLRLAPNYQRVLLNVRSCWRLLYI